MAKETAEYLLKKKSAYSSKCSYLSFKYHYLQTNTNKVIMGGGGESVEKIRVKEVKASEIRQKKESGKAKRRLLLKIICSAIIVAVFFIGIRATILWILQPENSSNLKESLGNRYYYGEGKISMFRHMNVTLFYSLPEFISNFKGDYGVVLNIVGFILALMYGVIAFSSIPIVYGGIYMICFIDSISPTKGNILLWWGVYGFILGAIVESIFRCFVLDEEEIKNRVVTLVKMLVLILIISTIGVRWIGNNPKEGVENSYNIKSIVNKEIKK